MEGEGGREESGGKGKGGEERRGRRGEGEKSMHVDVHIRRERRKRVERTRARHNRRN